MQNILINSRLHGQCNCLIDDGDLPIVSKYKWYVTKQGYVTTVLADGKKRTGIKLHRLIMDAPKGVMVDHKNRNKLDNRRENLRLATRASNNANRHKASTTDGVAWIKGSNRWVVHVGSGSKSSSYKGGFTDHNAALNCYNYYAKQIYGEFASLNACVPMSYSEWQAVRLRYDHASRFTYVHWDSEKQKWSTEITARKNKEPKQFIGYFSTEEEASNAYNQYLVSHSVHRKPSVLREPDRLGV